MKKGAVKFTFLGIALLILLFMIFFIPNAKSNPDTGVTNCSNLITPGEKYTLSNDILNNQIIDNCINISAANIILDCQGKYIFSIKNYSGVYTNATNVTIKNCNITVGSGGHANAFGIYLNGAGNSTISNNSVFGDSYAGIYLSSSNNNSLVNNSVKSNFSIGISLSTSRSNNLTIRNDGEMVEYNKSTRNQGGKQGDLLIETDYLKIFTTNKASISAVTKGLSDLTGYC